MIDADADSLVRALCRARDAITASLREHRRLTPNEVVVVKDARDALVVSLRRSGLTLGLEGHDSTWVAETLALIRDSGFGPNVESADEIDRVARALLADREEPDG